MFINRPTTRTTSTARAAHTFAALGLPLAIASLALALLLCLQWPLRDWVQAHSRTANDLGQMVFALYMAVALTLASAGGTHLAAHTTPNRRLGMTSNAKRWLYGACVLPWALYLLWSAILPAFHATVRWERFPETATAGYWLLHVAVCVLALGAALFAMQSLLKPKTVSPT